MLRTIVSPSRGGICLAALLGTSTVAGQGLPTNEVEPSAMAVPLVRRAVSRKRQVDDQESSADETKLSNLQLMTYVGEVQLGTPAQTFRMIFDTGSADLWVRVEVFHKAESHTLVCPPSACNEEAEIRYVDGSSYKGRIWRDSFSVAGVHIADQDFFIASIEHDQDEGDVDDFDGTVGLGFLGDSATYARDKQTRAWLYNYVHVAKHRVFSLVIGREEEPSWFIAGMPNLSLYNASPLVTLPGPDALSREFTGTVAAWAIQLDSVVVGNYSLEFYPLVAIVDSGSSFVGFPKSIFDRVLQFLAPSHVIAECHVGKHTLTCPCTHVDSMNSIYFDAGGELFPLRPEDYIMRVSADILGFPDTCFLEFTNEGDAAYITLGDTFMRTVVSVFDAEAKTVSLAQRRGGALLEVEEEILSAASFFIFGCIVATVLFCVVCVPVMLQRCIDWMCNQRREDAAYVQLE